MINPNQKTPIKWEKIFDEKYNFEEYFQPSQLGGIDILTGLNMLKTDIKAFISSLLQKQIEEVREKVEKVKNKKTGKVGYTSWGTGYMDCLDEILKELEKHG